VDNLPQDFIDLPAEYVGIDPGATETPLQVGDDPAVLIEQKGLRKTTATSSRCRASLSGFTDCLKPNRAVRYYRHRVALPNSDRGDQSHMSPQQVTRQLVQSNQRADWKAFRELLSRCAYSQYATYHVFGSELDVWLLDYCPNAIEATPAGEVQQ
jgi:hypothetical protein